MEDEFECENVFRDSSNGHHLFNESDRTLLLGSYVNHALIKGDKVYEILPGYVDEYNWKNINEKGESEISPITEAVEIMKKFK